LKKFYLVLGSVFMLALAPLNSVEAQTPSGTSCDIQICASQLQTTQNLQGQQGPSSANLTPLQPAAQGMSPQDGNPQIAKLDGLNLADEVEPSKPAIPILPIVLVLVLCLASLLTLAIVADWYFLHGKVRRKLIKR
jgi:hypothetical protein